MRFDRLKGGGEKCWVGGSHAQRERERERERERYGVDFS